MPRRFISMLCLCCLILTACVPTHAQLSEKNIYAMDTVITVRIPSDGSADARFAECERRISDYERLLSRTEPDSTVSAFNRSQSGVALDEETAKIVAALLALSEQTYGAFDLTVEPLTALWDITSDAPRVPEQSQIAEVLDAVGYDKLTLTDGFLSKTDARTRIDLGGAGKGYVLGAIADYLRSDGVLYGTVSFGGNIALIGNKPDGAPWKVGVRDPRDTDGIVGTLSLTQGYVAVSGDYERYFIADGVRYHHIFDPRTGYPADSGVYSVAVIARDALIADALSTALFVMGYERAVEFYRSGKYAFEAVFVTADGVQITDGLTDLYTADQ